MNGPATGKNETDPDSPCRLFVYLACDAPVGVVLRRGPSDWVRLSLWHTINDTFEHGQWMHARVYERRCDLSADGSLFVAFVRGSAGPSQGNADSWVTISRPPWFTALALWLVGGTYYTGGLFRDGYTLSIGWDTRSPDQGTLPAWLPTTTDHPPYIDRTNDWPDRTIWLNRLLREGWTRREAAEPETWERPSPSGDWTLAMVIHSNTDFRVFGGQYIIEYIVRSEPAGSKTSLGNATWADWDQHGRLILALNGRLLCWEAPGTLTEIADFNDQHPDPQPAPAWATEWPKPPTHRQ